MITLSVLTIQKATYAKFIFTSQFHTFQPAIKVNIRFCSRFKQLQHQNWIALVDSSHQGGGDRKIVVMGGHGRVVDGCFQANFVVLP